MKASTHELCPTEDPWTEHMQRGDFAAAWRICDAVLASRAGQPCSDWPRHQQYVWDGTPLEGKRVLIRCYHGLGDTVQFIRYAPLVKRVARKVIVWAQPVLIPLLRSAEGIDSLLPLTDGSPDVDYDVDIESMELPHAFRSTLETLPCDIPYLFPGASRAGTGAMEMSRNKLRALDIGLVWATAGWNEERSIPISTLSPLLDLKGVTWHVLQQGAAREAWPGDRAALPSSDRPEETAVVMQGLDLVISIDSFPAHLAGALGVPVWTLLQANSNWRWMRSRHFSPWYPTMRLFRQKELGDWTDVIATVASELRRSLAKRSRNSR